MKGKNNEKLVIYIRHDNTPENKVLINITNDLKWKLGITAVYTGKGTPHQNQLDELGSADIAGKARAMRPICWKKSNTSWVRNVSTMQST